MARPIKNNADYFPHDADMRNDARVKAVRRKFGLNGYAVYCMIIEYLTDAEHFQVKTDELGLELMSGDFDIETKLLSDILSYCVTVGLFQIENSILTCKSLENRLNPLLSKRERDRDRVIASENTHSKVKESKGEKSKEKQSSKMVATEVATIEERRDSFLKRFEPHLNEYPKEMLREFFDYWVEKNDGGRKMRFEMQKVFDISRRLKTWSKNNYNGGRINKTGGSGKSISDLVNEGYGNIAGAKG